MSTFEENVDDAALPVESRLVDIGGAKLEATIGGVLSPGAPLICSAHPAAAFGKTTVGILAEAARTNVVCLNARGLGRSSALPSEGVYTLEQMVDDFEAARQRLGVGPWVFWGLSGGGWFGEIYAKRHPHAIAGLILESVCGCFRRRLADPDCLFSPLHPSWRGILSDAGLLGARPDEDDAAPIATEWIDLQGVGSVFRRVGGPALLVSPGELSADMRRVMPVMWTVDARPWLGSLAVPTLVLHGMADPFVPYAQVRALHESVAGSELVAIEAAGHVPVMEHRAKVGEAVRGFLAKNWPALPSTAAAPAISSRR